LTLFNTITDLNMEIKAKIIYLLLLPFKICLTYEYLTRTTTFNNNYEKVSLLPTNPTMNNEGSCAGVKDKMARIVLFESTVEVKSSDNPPKVVYYSYGTGPMKESSKDKGKIRMQICSFSASLSNSCTDTTKFEAKTTQSQYIYNKETKTFETIPCVSCDLKTESAEGACMNLLTDDQTSINMKTLLGYCMGDHYNKYVESWNSKPIYDSKQTGCDLNSVDLTKKFQDVGLQFKRKTRKIRNIINNKIKQLDFGHHTIHETK